MKQILVNVTRILPVWALVLLPLTAEAADPGLTVLSFLKLGAGARATAMGEAYVSVAADASAGYWNPAGLLWIKRNDVEGSHNEWIQDLRHEFVAFGARRGRHAIGISFIGLYTEDLEERAPETGEFLGHFGFSDNAFALSYGFRVHERLGLGATLRYLRESIVGTSDGDFALTGSAVDFGAMWETPVRGVTAGGVFRYLGSQLGYDQPGSQDFDLPTTLQVGVSYRRSDFQGGTLVVASDLVAARGEDASVHVGAEYAHKGQFLLGAGIKTGLDNENVSFGVGYQKKIRAHYAFTPIYNDLGSSHRISVGYAW